MNRPPFYVLGALVLLLAVAYYFYNNSIPAYWEINTAESSLSFTSVKNGDVEEVHTISEISGEADFSGEFLIFIDLADVETNIDIRNQRMKELLFETDTYPVATLSGDFSLSSFEDLNLDEGVEVTISATLKLHGVKKDLEIRVLVERQGWRKVKITPVEPVLISVADFNLAQGLEQLQSIAGLDAIEGTIPVEFEVVFDGVSIPAES